MNRDPEEVNPVAALSFIGLFHWWMLVVVFLRGDPAWDRFQPWVEAIFWMDLMIGVMTFWYYFLYKLYTFLMALVCLVEFVWYVAKRALQEIRR